MPAGGWHRLPVTTATSHGGNEPAPALNDRPEQNIADDEAVHGRPLTAEQRDRAIKEGPVSDWVGRLPHFPGMWLAEYDGMKALEPS